jgi:hypothetical protein
MEKLHWITKSMAKSKSHGLDGVVANFISELLWLNWKNLFRMIDLNQSNGNNQL